MGRWNITATDTRTGKPVTFDHTNAAAETPEEAVAFFGTLMRNLKDIKAEPWTPEGDRPKKPVPADYTRTGVIEQVKAAAAGQPPAAHPPGPTVGVAAQPTPPAAGAPVGH